MRKKGDFLGVFRNNTILLGYIFKFAPEIFIWKVLSIIMILVSDVTFNILFIKYIVDSIGKNIDIKIIFVYIILLGIGRMICDIVNTYYQQYIEPVSRQKIYKGIYNIIYKKIVDVDLEKFDDVNFYNDYIWALDKVEDKTKNSFNILTQFIQNLINVLVYSFISIIYDKVLLIIVVLPVLINIFVGMYKARIGYELVKELTPVNRQRDYSRRSFYLNQYAKEIKTYNVGSILLRNFNNCIDKNIKIIKKYKNKMIISSFAVTHSGWMFAKVISALYMSYKVLVLHSYSVGVFVTIYISIGTLINNLIALFLIVPRLQENSLFSAKILKIINYKSNIESRIGDNVSEEFEKLEIRNLSFQYPNSEEMTLKNVNMCIKKGEKVALVGRNGVGKSTLIKMILNLYDPTEGEILLNCKNIKQFTTREYRKKFSTIFQDYQIYGIKLIENIFMRNIEIDDYDKAFEFLKDSNLDEYINRLDNNVTKEFDKDGVVFSGGQSQKLAIARAFAHGGDILIMDEASSALDPIAENEINQLVMKKMKDKSIIVIAHRLSTIKHMDKIYFMDGGSIVEEGTHDKLIELNGKYAHMYNVQAEKYRIIRNEIQ